MQDPTDSFDPIPGQAETLRPGLRRVLAPNPSPMTFRGTNTYLLGRGDVAVIDPGPDLSGHLEAIMDALRPGERVTTILVTHSHRDHRPLARRLAEATGAPVLAAGTSDTGRSAVMRALSAEGLTGGGEGVDREFRPDRTLSDTEVLPVDGQPLTALSTPGHMGNHMAFAWGGAVFCGDLVMGWASTMVSPPDGDLSDFYNSCALLRARTETVFFPGHGAPVTNPRGRIDWIVEHRRQRDRQIRSALSAAPGTVEEIAARVYGDLDPRLLPAAGRNVLAHLIDLHGRGQVVADPSLSISARYTLIAAQA